MTDQQIKDKANYRTVSIRIIDGSTVHGRVNIAPDSYVSDLLSKPEGFLILADASYIDSKAKTLFINKDHIIWIEPED